MACCEKEYPYNQKVVSLGGGTGHFTWLRSAVSYNYPENITAMPGGWDSGSVSGRLRVEQGVLPPGDYMQCLVALMEDPNQVQEAFYILRDRTNGDPIAHLLASKSEKVHHGIQEGIDGLRKLYRVRGKIIPISFTDVDLNAKTKFGEIIEMEHRIDDKKKDSAFGLADEVSRIYFDVVPEPNPEALNAIHKAEKIILPPGSPYTSIFPHLLVGRGRVAQEILESDAKLIAILNLMTTTTGEDHHLRKASRWLDVFQYYLGDKEYIQRYGKSRINYFVVNENHIDKDILDVYESQKQKPVIVDEEQCRKQAPGMEIVCENLATFDKFEHLLRHDPDKLAPLVLGLD